MALASPYQYWPANIVEQRAMQNLACVCPTCNKEPIEDCQCELAVKMRGEVIAQMRGADLSTADGRETAYKAVRAAFAAKYGADVLTPRAEVKTDGRLDALPIIVFGGGLATVAVIARRSLRRRRDQKRAD